MEDIVNIISSVGFPIAMCLLLFWKSSQQDVNYKTMIEGLTNVINDNTKINTKINDTLEKILLNIGGK